MKKLLMRGLLSCCALGCAVGGCSGDTAQPRDQWFVMVSTDAPVPALGDRLLLEVLDDEGAVCDGCSRLLGASSAASWPFTFGVVSPKDGQVRVLRARLFRAELTGEDGYPTGEAYLDLLGILPPVRGETEVAVELEMACFGVIGSLEQARSCDPSTGTLEPLQVLRSKSKSDVVLPGSWGAATPRPCLGSTPEGMQCVPGGAFLLGSSRVIAPKELASLPERVVRVSPFFLDRDEVTVGAVREAMSAGELSEGPIERDTTPGSMRAYCTYLGVSDATNDAMPVNCVSARVAEAFCALSGKRLPTEAEWEYAASNAGAETTYPWGEDEDICAHAVVARAWLDENVAGPAHCLASLPGSVLPGPVAGGHEGDSTYLGLRNLGGNLSEWVSDAYAQYDDPCWGDATGLLEDPTCHLDGALKRSLRGGSWLSMRSGAEGARRHTQSAWSSGDAQVGFRCAQSM